MIAVTGANGEPGRRVVARLAKMEVRQRLVVRDPEHAPRLPGAEVAVASAYGDAVTMGRALHGVETLFLIADRDLFGLVWNAFMPGPTPPKYDRLQQRLTAVDADVAAVVLTQSGHDGLTYNVTGPEALTLSETAGKLLFATGRVSGVMVALAPVVCPDRGNLGHGEVATVIKEKAGFQLRREYHTSRSVFYIT
jgi:uncharacterized protein YbjT (DUF2867 family)